MTDRTRARNGRPDLMCREWCNAIGPTVGPTRRYISERSMKALRAPAGLPLERRGVCAGAPAQGVRLTSPRKEASVPVQHATDQAGWIAWRHSLSLTT